MKLRFGLSKCGVKIFRPYSYHAQPLTLQPSATCDLTHQKKKPFQNRQLKSSRWGARKAGEGFMQHVAD